jgi:uncharacterized membrane protein YccC
MAGDDVLSDEAIDELIAEHGFAAVPGSLRRDLVALLRAVAHPAQQRERERPQVWVDGKLIDVRLAHEYIGQLEAAARLREIDCANQAAEIADLRQELERHAAKLIAALAPLGVSMMDPPDGGDVSLYEQVERCVAEIARLNGQLAELRGALTAIELQCVGHADALSTKAGGA